MDHKKVKRQTCEIDILVGKTAKKIRRLNKISQASAGEKIGVSFQQIQKYEKGKNRMGAATLYRLSKLYGISVQDFFSGLEGGKTTRIYDLNKESIELLNAFEALGSDELKKALITLLKNMSGTLS